MAVIVVLGVLSAVAIPRYFDHAARAEYRTADAVAGAAQSGVAQANAALAIGLADPVLSDVDGNDRIDHLGDLDHLEPTLLDAIMDPPLPNMRGLGVGWKAANPLFGPGTATYFYDVDGDDVLDVTPFHNEPALIYSFTTGRLQYFPDSRAP